MRFVALLSFITFSALASERPTLYRCGSENGQVRLFVYDQGAVADATGDLIIGKDNNVMICAESFRPEVLLHCVGRNNSDLSVSILRNNSAVVEPIGAELFCK